MVADVSTATTIVARREVSVASIIWDILEFLLFVFRVCIFIRTMGAALLRRAAECTEKDNLL